MSSKNHKQCLPASTAFKHEDCMVSNYHDDQLSHVEGPCDQHVKVSLSSPKHMVASAGKCAKINMITGSEQKDGLDGNVNWDKIPILPHMLESFKYFLDIAPKRWHYPAVQAKVFTLPIGGRLKYFYRQWLTITHDPFVLQCIKGIRVPLKENPIQHRLPNSLRLNQHDKEAIDTDVRALLDQRVIIKVIPKPDQIVSNLFTIKKKSGKLCSILNLCDFNTFVPVESFKCDSIEVLLRLLFHHAWLISVDIRHAWYHLALLPKYRKYFTFDWKRQRYMYTCTSMGLNLVPKIYTRVFKAFLAHIRKQFNICITSFLDDTCQISESRFSARRVIKHNSRNVQVWFRSQL